MMSKYRVNSPLYPRDFKLNMYKKKKPQQEPL